MDAMKVRLRISLAALTVLISTVSLAALKAGRQQNPFAGHGTQAEQQHADLPQWPYPPDSATSSLPPDDGQPHHIPGSTKAYTLKQVYADSAADWFPDEHPPAPVSVSDGKAGAYRACGSCHLINGNGKPEMQSLNGMPVAYMRQQLQDMKSDLRLGSVTEGATTNMIVTAKAVSEADANEALEYFHSMPPAKWIRVVEAKTVPKTLFGLHTLPFPDPSGAKESLGNRILEMPENYDRALLRDSTSGYVVYVPLGSVTRGEALVKTGAGGRTIACITCHGEDLRNGISGIIPPIAGRNPTSIGRQLYDFKTGARHGQNSSMMKPVVEKLTDEDIVDISAYLASLPQ
jgi:cytochrome c553